MKFLFWILALGLLICSNSFADIKKPKISKIGIIFPTIESEQFPCRAYNPIYKPIPLIATVEATASYGLDDRYDYAYQRLEKVSVSCSSGDLKACESVYKTLLSWAESNAAKRTGASDEESKHWDDTLTVNLYVAAPMITAYSFALQRIDVPMGEDEKIKKWLKKIVKKNQHLMHNKTYKTGTQAKGVPKRAHNHALSSAMAHMSLAILLGDDKMFKKPFKNWIGAVKYQRKDGSLPIETRRGGRAMFYTGRAMTALATIAVMAENQNIDIWNTQFKKNKDYHNIVKFFLDFAENPEIVFKYAKEMKAPGPAKDYKNQDLNSSGSVWGWMPAYASRFPNHENIEKIKSWDKDKMNKYQKLVSSALSSIGDGSRSFAASWNMGVEPNCHFIR